MNLTASTLLAVSLMWPFGQADKKDPPPRDGTLGTLQDHPADLPPEPPVEQSNERARQGYQQYLDQANADPKLAAEAMRRIADLELDNADVMEASGGNDSERQASYRKAAALYRELLKRYPADPRNDQVLYQLARAEDGAGAQPAALAVLSQLATQYPASPLLIEAQFRRGEILFTQHRYADAEAAYTAVVAKGTDTPYFEQGLYKQGWSRFKQDDYQKSLDSFFELLDRRLAGIAPNRMEAQMAALPKAEHELIDDTLRAMALACIDIGSPKTIDEQLQKHHEPAYGFLVYRGLATIYLKEQRYSDAAATLSGFADTHPDHPQAPAFQIQAIDALQSGGFTSQALALRESYVARFGLDQPFWKSQNPADEAPAIDYLRDSVWTLAQQHHALAQNPAASPSARAADTASAVQDYRRYVQYFPQDARAPQAEFRLGDLLYETGDLPGAIDAYEAAAYNYPNFDRRADAGYAALQASQKYENQLSGDAREAWHRKRLNSDLRFADQFPDRQEAAQVRSNAAAGLFEAGDAATAIVAAQRVANDPKADVNSRRVAWRVIGHASFDAHDYAKAEAAYLEVQKLDPPGAPKDRDITERLAASIYKQGEQAQAANQPLAAAGLFSRVADEAPDTKIRVTADYDAAMSTLKAGQSAQAIPMLLAFREHYPGDPLVAEVTRTLALTYEKTGKPVDAATELQRIAETPHTDPELQRQALWHSIELLQPVDPVAAQRNLHEYLDRFPAPFDQAIEAHQKLIDLAKARNDAIAESSESSSLVRFEATGGDQRTERSRSLAAHASLVYAQATRDNFRSIALTLPLKASLAAKRQALEAALSAYAHCADYGVADVLTESTYETAELYHDLAKALKESERPRDLDAAALEQYNLLLDEQVFPFEDKAISIHEANVHRAKDGLYDYWVQKSYSELAGLAPGRYAKGELPEQAVPIADATAAASVSSQVNLAFDQAVANLKAGNGEAAEAGFKALQKDYPKLPGPEVNLALTYRLLNHPVDEEKTLRGAVAQNPKSATAQHQLGIWLRRQGHFAEADDAYVKAIAADPKYQAAHYDRGVLNDLYLQRPAVAIAEYETYQSLLGEATDKRVGRWIIDLKHRSGVPTTAPEPESKAASEPAAPAESPKGETP